MWRGNPRLARSPAVQIDLDLVVSDGNPRWTAVERDAYAASIKFSPGGYAEDAAEGVACAG